MMAMMLPSFVPMLERRRLVSAERMVNGLCVAY
jgi:hypothetical protein